MGKAMFMPAFSRRVREVSLCTIAAVFVLLLGIGVATRAYFVRIDTAVVETLHSSLGIPGLTATIHDVTELGGTTAAVLLTTGIALFLMSRNHWHGALALIVSVAVTQLLVAFLKGLVERGRPAADHARVEADGYAFPSAHSATSVALYGVLGFIAGSHLEGRARTFARTLCATVILAVGGTRIYLGAHYPTDVLAGWLVGAVVALATWRAAQALRDLHHRRLAIAPG